LDAFENAARVNGKRDRRHRVEHIEMLSPDDMSRFKELGVIASMQPIHVVPVQDTAMERAAGPERMRRSYPWRGLVESGARLAFSSDWAVADMNPLLGIHAAVTRDWYGNADQKVSLETAIRAYTIDGAYASFEEDLKGSLKPGKLADFIVLSDNLFQIEQDKIPECCVLMTVLGGRIVHDAMIDAD
jgi:predicted amidohydrolase YtcJ